MVYLLRDVMGLRVEFSEATTTELSLPSGDRVQVFAPADPDYKFVQRHATSAPIPLFEVEDVRIAHADLLAAGIEIVGEIEHDNEWEWLHFRGPDGSLYEVGRRLTGTK